MFEKPLVLKTASMRGWGRPYTAPLSPTPKFDRFFKPRKNLDFLIGVKKPVKKIFDGPWVTSRISISFPESLLFPDHRPGSQKTRLRDGPKKFCACITVCVCTEPFKKPLCDPTFADVEIDKTTGYETFFRVWPKAVRVKTMSTGVSVSSSVFLSAEKPKNKYSRTQIPPTIRAVSVLDFWGPIFLIYH
jgi:hypothetical protein